MYYGEEFLRGDVTFGAYVCELILSDPDGFTMQPGGPGTFVTPAARDHGGPLVTTPVKGPISSAGERPFLKNEADPLHDLLGPGKLSHPEEWKKTIEALRQEKVRVVFREGVMAYGPDSAPGYPGQLIIDPEASIGALRHEAQHFKDDKELGFPGSAALYKNPSLRWRMEYTAYMQEVGLARQLRTFGIGRQLISHARSEKKYIQDNFGPF